MQVCRKGEGSRVMVLWAVQLAKASIQTKGNVCHAPTANYDEWSLLSSCL